MKSKVATVSSAQIREGRKASVDADMEPLSGSELERPGAILMNLLLTVANARGMDRDELVRELEISQSYFKNLRSGDKPISKLGKEIIDRIAHFLKMPPVAVMLAAGQLDLQDFYVSSTATLQEEIQRALKLVLSDPRFAPLIPASILKAETAVQQSFVMFYELATGRALLPGRVSFEEIVRRHLELVDSTGAASKK